MESIAVTTNLTIRNKESVDVDMQENGVLWKRVNTVTLVTYSLVFVLGTIGNGLVIFITGFRMKKMVNTVWIFSLAVADFIFSFFLLFNIVQASLEFDWPFGRIMCKLKDTIVFVNLIASIYTLMVISIDRCVAVRCPVWAQNHRTPRLASFVVLGVWILSVVFCSPNVYFKDTYYDEKTNTTKCRNNYDINAAGGKTTRNAVVLVRFIFGFVIPFSVIVVCYGAILVRLRRDQLSQSSKPFKVITAVIVAFFVCWFPYHIFNFLVKSFDHPRRYVVVFVGFRLSYGLAYFNSCLNPILYFCMGHNFKGKLRCSILTALVNAFTEERPSVELEPQGL